MTSNNLLTSMKQMLKTTLDYKAVKNIQILENRNKVRCIAEIEIAEEIISYSKPIDGKYMMIQYFMMMMSSLRKLLM